MGDVLKLTHLQATTCKGCGGPLDNDGPVTLFIKQAALCHDTCARGYVRALRRQGRRMVELIGFDMPDDAAARKRLLHFFGNTHGDAGVLHGYRFVYVKGEEFGYAVQFGQDNEKVAREIQWYPELNKEVGGGYVPKRDGPDPRKFHIDLWCDGFFVLEVFGAVTPESIARLLRNHAPGMAVKQHVDQKQPPPLQSNVRLEPAVANAHPTIAFSAHVLRANNRTFIFVRARLHGDTASQYVPKSLWHAGDAVEQPWNEAMSMFAQRLAGSLKARANTATGGDAKGATFRLIAKRTRAQLYAGNRLGVNLQYITKGDTVFCLKSATGGAEDWSRPPTVYHVFDAKAYGVWPLFATTHFPDEMVLCKEIVVAAPAVVVPVAAAAGAGAAAAAAAKKN